MLARQLAMLFGLPCYDGLDFAMDDYNSIVCWLHFIIKIAGHKPYDLIIFDDMALIVVDLS
jgi:hypothetical protein